MIELILTDILKAQGRTNELLEQMLAARREPELLSLTKAAAKLDMSRATLRKQLASGAFKRYGSGRCQKVDLAEIRRQLSAQGQRPLRIVKADGPVLHLPV